mmetsp:Transcript_40717/g.62151  ORF Transcript_40717/g.62151 Transcript_40717/m.62151 type:complete len:162 (+) Transcript_40717:1-486(+)
MKHKRFYRKLGRTPKHRRALFRNLATSLVLQERIVTTEAKAKELRPFIERLIHKARAQDHNAHRYVHSYLFTNISTKRLFKIILPRFDAMQLPAGFTRITRLGPRYEDCAKMAVIEFVGNPILENEVSVQEVNFHNKNFFQWELNILKGEQQHFKDHLDTL